MAKTVLGLLVGIAFDRGEIASLDQPLSAFLSEWADQPRGVITLRQLGQMASGLEQVGAGHGYAVTPDNPAVRQAFGGDFAGPALALEPDHPPGERFDYNNANSLLLAIVLERVSGRRYIELLGERLWRPLGLGRASSYVDRPGGMAMTSAALFSRPIDWIALGQLILDRGAGPDGRLVSADWIDAMAAPSLANPGYGFQLWLADQAVSGPRVAMAPLAGWMSEPFADPATVLMLGHGMQRVWIMPARRLVILRAGQSWPPFWDEAIIPNTIFRGVTA